MVYKKKNPFVLLMLSIFVPGLGQMYNGQLMKGIIYIIIVYIITFIFVATKLLQNFNGFITYTIILICLWLFIISDALYNAKNQKEMILKSYNKLFFYLLFALANTAIYLGSQYLFGIESFKVPSFGMEPTLIKGDYFAGDKKFYSVNKPQRDDVIIVKYPNRPSAYAAKRIIGIEGDTVEIKNKQIVLNGAIYNDAHSSYKSSKNMMSEESGPIDDMRSVVIQKDHIFVLGDNRDMSVDSRHWGQMPTDDIIAKVFYIYWSWDNENITIRWERIGNIK